MSHAKSAEQKAQIKDFIKRSQNFLFREMQDQRADMVADAMFEKKVRAGETVIKQGDIGDNFYIVGSGDLQCFVQRDADEEPKKVLDYAPGGSFGELALMYLCPRAATVKAVSDCVLWGIDAIQFKALISGGDEPPKREWEDFLDTVQALQGLNKFERMTLAEIVECEDCGKDEIVIKKGDETADFFYIVESGMCVAYVDGGNGTEVLEAKQFAKGEYFGELEILQGGPRQVTV